MKAILITIVVIAVVAVLGSDVLIFALRALGLIATNGVLG